MEFNLKNVLKALLFSTSESLKVRDIQDVIMRFHQENKDATLIEEEGQQIMGPIMQQAPSLVTTTQIREAMAGLSEELIEEDSVYRILDKGDAYGLGLAPQYSEWVRLLRKEPKPLKLSQVLLETLAIIAYRQPVTRGQIESIRGVSVDNAVTKLLDHELIHVLGRAELPGRPMQYGTTHLFLELCSISSLEELPSSEIFQSTQVDAIIESKGTPKEPISDKEVGLFEDTDTPKEGE